MTMHAADGDDVEEAEAGEGESENHDADGDVDDQLLNNKNTVGAIEVDTDNQRRQGAHDGAEVEGNGIQDKADTPV